MTTWPKPNTPPMPAPPTGMPTSPSRLTVAAPTTSEVPAGSVPALTSSTPYEPARPGDRLSAANALTLFPEQLNVAFSRPGTSYTVAEVGARHRPVLEVLAQERVVLHLLRGHRLLRQLRAGREGGTPAHDHQG